jgi:hypothetical protein
MHGQQAMVAGYSRGCPIGRAAYKGRTAKKMKNTNASGLNLSAFGVTKRPVFAEATDEGDGNVRVVLSEAAGFDMRAKLGDPVEPLFAAWRGALVAAAKPLAVDIALETESAAARDYLWRLNQRDIDFAFYGDAPLTDRIGEFGVRFRGMLQGAPVEIGRELIEAAPRASIDLMGFRGQYQDGKAHHGKGGWKADDKTRRPDKLLAAILTELGVNPEAGAEKFGSGELDAMLCALTALAQARGDTLLRGAELAAEIAARCERRANLAAGSLAATVPASCAVLAEPFWESITVSRGESPNRGRA